MNYPSSGKKNLILSELFKYIIVISLFYGYDNVCKVAAQEQARQYLQLRDTGFIETATGALIPVYDS